MANKILLHTTTGIFVGDLLDITTGQSPKDITGYTISNAWFLNNLGDLRVVLATLLKPPGNLERTIIRSDTWINVTHIISLQISSNAGPGWEAP